MGKTPVIYIISTQSVSLCNGIGVFFLIFGRISRILKIHITGIDDGQIFTAEPVCITQDSVRWRVRRSICRKSIEHMPAVICQNSVCGICAHTNQGQVRLINDKSLTGWSTVHMVDIRLYINENRLLPGTAGSIENCFL